jgi:hypothetical protein
VAISVAARGSLNNNGNTVDDIVSSRHERIDASTFAAPLFASLSLRTNCTMRRLLKLRVLTFRLTTERDLTEDVVKVVMRVSAMGCLADRSPLTY